MYLGKEIIFIPIKLRRMLCPVVKYLVVYLDQVSSDRSIIKRYYRLDNKVNLYCYKILNCKVCASV